jgi:hypothetical protein
VEFLPHGFILDGKSLTGAYYNYILTGTAADLNSTWGWNSTWPRFNGTWPLWNSTADGTWWNGTANGTAWGNHTANGTAPWDRALMNGTLAVEGAGQWNGTADDRWWNGSSSAGPAGYNHSSGGVDYHEYSKWRAYREVREAGAVLRSTGVEDLWVVGATELQQPLYKVACEAMNITYNVSGRCPRLQAAPWGSHRQRPDCLHMETYRAGHGSAVRQYSQEANI